jgi:hypothetical protein
MENKGEAIKKGESWLEEKAAVGGQAELSAYAFEVEFGLIHDPVGGTRGESFWDKTVMVNEVEIEEVP